MSLRLIFPAAICHRNILLNLSSRPQMLPSAILLAHLQDTKLSDSRLCSGSIHSVLVSRHTLGIDLWLYTSQGCLEPNDSRCALHQIRRFLPWQWSAQFIRRCYYSLYAYANGVDTSARPAKESSPHCSIFIRKLCHGQQHCPHCISHRRVKTWGGHTM